MERQATARPRSRSLLVAARVVAGVLAVVQLAGVFFFTVMAREEAVWLGPLVDIPVIGLMVLGMLLKLACAVWPGLAARRRIVLGLAGAALGIVMTLVKIPLYDEPEGVTFLVADLLLVALLLLAGRQLAAAPGERDSAGRSRLTQRAS
jgi:hypothetical protein